MPKKLKLVLPSVIARQGLAPARFERGLRKQMARIDAELAARFFRAGPQLADEFFLRLRTPIQLLRAGVCHRQFCTGGDDGPIIDRLRDLCRHRLHRRDGGETEDFSGEGAGVERLPRGVASPLRVNCCTSMSANPSPLPRDSSTAIWSSNIP